MESNSLRTFFYVFFILQLMQSYIFHFLSAWVQTLLRFVGPCLMPPTLEASVSSHNPKTSMKFMIRTEHDFKVELSVKGLWTDNL